MKCDRCYLSFDLEDPDAGDYCPSCGSAVCAACNTEVNPAFDAAGNCNLCDGVPE